MLRQKIQDDQLKALKSGDKKLLEMLRYILAQIKNKEIDKKAELDDNEVLDTLRKIVKELKESIESFTKGGRTDLAAESQSQLAIVETYLPQQLSDEELKAAVQTIVDNNRELYEKNAKAIIGVCMKELKNKADSSRVMAILNTMS